MPTPRSEIAMLLGYAAQRDQRRISADDVNTWHEHLGAYDRAEIREAIKRHFDESVDRLMPAHVIAHIRVIRAERERLQRNPILDVPGRFDPDTARAERTARGVSRIRDLLAQLKIGPKENLGPDPDNPRHVAAVRRARADKAERQRQARINPHG